MKVFKNRDSWETIECELLPLASFYAYDRANLKKYDLSIVYDKNQEQYYAIDNKTGLILTAHLSRFQTIIWLDSIGYDLIELKRKYDKVRYQEDIKHYDNLKLREACYEHNRSNV